MAATDDELRFHREQRTRALAAVGSDGGSALQLQSKQRAIALYDATSPVDADYRTPEHFARTVSPKARRELADLLSALREFRAQLAGLTLGDAQVLYNGDEYALLLRDEFDGWITAHAKARLANPSPRDNGDLVATNLRLTDEFGQWFENLVLEPSTGHMVPLYRLQKKLNWELYKRTWGRWVEHDARGLVLGVEGPNPLISLELAWVLEQNNWHREGLIETLAADSPQFVAAGDPAAIDDELLTVTRDLVEVQGLLSRTFVPSANVVEVSPGIFAGWNWDVGHLAGTVNIGTSAAEVAEQLDKGTANFSFSLDLAGKPRETTTPWVDLGPGVAGWTLGVVRPIHAHLVRLWDAAERPVATVEGAGPDGQDGEAIAAACEALAVADAGHDDGVGPRLRVPAVRTVTLLALLQRAFAVEVRQGKGSEITVYRAGAKKYTLPNHKRNVHFPSHIVRAMLKALDIGATEFCVAAGAT